MQPAILRKLLISLWIGLPVVPAVAANDGIYMGPDQNASVELSNLPGNENYKLIIGSPSPASSIPSHSFTEVLETSAMTPAEPVQTTNPESAQFQDKLPDEEQRQLALPQTTPRGYLESMLKARGMDSSKIHGIDRQQTNR